MKLPSLKKEDPGPDMAVSSALPLTLHPYRASTLLYIPLGKISSRRHCSADTGANGSTPNRPPSGGPVYRSLNGMGVVTQAH